MLNSRGIVPKRRKRRKKILSSTKAPKDIVPRRKVELDEPSDICKELSKKIASCLAHSLRQLRKRSVYATLSLRTSSENGEVITVTRAVEEVCRMQPSLRRELQERMIRKQTEYPVARRSCELCGERTYHRGDRGPCWLCLDLVNELTLYPAVFTDALLTGTCRCKTMWSLRCNFCRLHRLMSSPYTKNEQGVDIKIVTLTKFIWVEMF